MYWIVFRCSFTVQNSGKHRLFCTGLRPNLFLLHCIIVQVWKTSQYLWLCGCFCQKTSSLMDRSGYRFPLISAGRFTVIRVSRGVRHCWHNALCSCLCNVHKDPEQSSLPLYWHLKMSLTHWGFSVRGAYSGIKLWLSVISYNLQMAWLVEMLKTIRSYSFSCIKWEAHGSSGIYFNMHQSPHQILQLVLQLSSHFPLDSI